MGDIIRAKNWDKSKVYVLDTETTGIKENDEILSLSILDYEGNVIFDHLIKPAKRKTWAKAQELHGISPKDVKNEKTLVEYEDELKPIFGKGNLLVGYNIDFDFEMLCQSGAHFQCDLFDVMDTYSQIYGKWSDWKQERLWCKLTQCANHYGYGKFEAHGSLEDTKATLFCFKKICEDEKVLEYWRCKFGYKENETTEERDERKKQETAKLEQKQKEQENQRKIKEQTDNMRNWVIAIVIIAVLFGLFKGCTGL